MKKLFVLLILIGSACQISFSQLSRIYVDQIVHDGTIPVLAGQTSFRLYAQTTSSADGVVEVTGDPVACIANVSTSTSFFRDGFASGITGKGINGGLTGIGAPFDALRWSSYVTIAYNSSITRGIPFDEDATGEEAFVTATDIHTVGAYTTAFSTGGSIDISLSPGGSWFSIPGDANTFGTGVDNSVLLGQFTTDGDFDFDINVSVIHDGGNLVPYTWCDDAADIDNLIYPEAGCTDINACNYNSHADTDDGSCQLPGDSCDDGDAGTENDVLQTDCSCAGAGESGFNSCSEATPLIIDAAPFPSSNVGTTDENGDPAGEVEAIDPACWGADGTDGDVWFSFVGTGSLVDINTYDFDTQIALYDACGGNLVACDDDFYGAPVWNSSIQAFCAEDGTTYYLEVEGWNGGEGAFTVEVVSSSIVLTYCNNPCYPDYNYIEPSPCYIEDCSFIDFSGCTDSTACNFCDSAIDDDGSCEYISCSGCTNSNAVNFNPEATILDSSCLFSGCNDAPMNWSYCYDNDENSIFNFIGTTDLDVVTIVFNAGTVEAGWGELRVYDGADNNAALLSADPVDGDLTGLAYQSTGQFLTVEIISDTFNSCVSGGQTAIDADYYCSTIEVIGCTDTFAINFDLNATLDDGSCIESVCNDPPLEASFCYSSNLNYGFVLSGFTLSDLPIIQFTSGTIEEGWDTIEFFDGSDNTAPSLGVYNGDLTDLIIWGSSSFLYVEIISDSINSCESGGQTEIEFIYYCSEINSPGCNDDPNHCSYNPLSFVSCSQIEPCPGPPNDDFSNATLIEPLMEENCNPISGNNLYATDSPESLNNRKDVWYEFQLEQPAVASVQVSNPANDIDLIVELFNSELVLLELSDMSFTGGTETINEVLQSGVYYLNVAGWGNDAQGTFQVCLMTLSQDSTEELGINAHGCLDAQACNFNPEAVFPDDSCILQGQGDYNADNWVTVADLVGFLNEFGLNGTCMPGDMDLSGDVNSTDLTLFLTVFGSQLD